MVIDDSDTHLIPANPPPSQERYWTSLRQDIHEWLHGTAPSLAELYKGAVHLIYDTPLPGRIRFVAHAVREIRNRLPDEVSSTKPNSRKRLDYTSQIDQIAEMWKKNNLGGKNLLAGADGETQGQIPSSPNTNIPPELFLLIESLINAHEETRAKPIEAALRLFQTRDLESSYDQASLRPVAEHWFQTTEWFMRKTHDSGAIDADCDEKELQEHFELFEWFLSTLSRPFFSTSEELDEILEDANA